MRFDAERSEVPNRMARKYFNNILNSCFKREIISLYFNQFITIQLCNTLSNQGKYDE